METISLAMPEATDVATLLTITLMFFAVVGLNLYRGMFGYCRGGEDGNLFRYTVDEQDCVGSVNVTLAGGVIETYTRR